MTTRSYGRCFALSTVKIVKHAVLKIYEGADHGLTQTHQDRFNADLLAFITADTTHTGDTDMSQNTFSLPAHPMASAPSMPNVWQNVATISFSWRGAPKN